MIQDAIPRADISLRLFRSTTETYIASFLWDKEEMHTYGRKCGNASVFLMKNSKGKTVGFLSFTIDSNERSLTVNTGGTTGKYRNLGYGIPLMDSFSSLVLIMGIEDVETTLGHENPFVLMLITRTYGYGPVNKDWERSLMIGPPMGGQPNLYPVHFVGNEARRRIEHGRTEDPPDPFGPRYDTVENSNDMPSDSSIVYIGVPYQIINRAKLYRRIFAFLPHLNHHPDPAMPSKPIIWKSRFLAKAQTFLISQSQGLEPEEK